MKEKRTAPPQGAPLAWRTLLPYLMTWATGHARYLPQEQLESDSLIFKAFRAYERIFWRRHGVRPEVSMYYAELEDGTLRQIHRAHSLESALILGEYWVRGVFKLGRSVRVHIPVLSFALPTGGEFRMPSSPYLFAIAFDSHFDTVDHTGIGSTTTDSFTNTAGNVMAVGYIDRNGNHLTGVTYGGDTMTSWKVQAENGGNEGYIYGRISPKTGANNIVASWSATGIEIRIVATSYSGAGTSSQPDATNSGAGTTGSSATASVTSVTDNSWAIAFFWNEAANNTAGTGSTLRTGAGNPSIMDSNGAIHPAGSYNMTASWGSSTTWIWIAAVIAAVGSTTYNQTVPAIGAGAGAVAKAATFRRTYAAIGAGTANVKKGITAAFSTLHAIGAGVGTVKKGITMSITTLHAIGAGSAAVAASRAFLKTLAAVGAGTATVTERFIYGKVLAATAAGQAALAKTIHVSKVLAAIGAGVATTKATRGIVLHAISAGVATLTHTLGKTLTAVASASALIRKDFWKVKYPKRGDDYDVKYPHGR